MAEATSGHELWPRDLPPLHIRIAAAILAWVGGPLWIFTVFCVVALERWPWW